MPPPPRRPNDRRDPEPQLSGVILDAEVLDAEVLDADVLDGEVLDAEVFDAGVVEGEVIEGEILDGAPLEPADPAGDDPPAVFDLDLIDAAPGPAVATAQTPALPLYELVATDQAPTGADLLALDADRPRPAVRTALHPPTATRPAVRVTFVGPGEASPFDPRG